MRICFVLGLSLALIAGCQAKPYGVASVSGIVKLDGNPLPKASVTFVPMATKDNQNPGPTAQGMTDTGGRFQLSVDPQTPGAVVGKCRVYITTLLSDPADDRDAGGPVKRVRDRVPARYNQATELTLDVPAAGTDKANFDLKSN